jgi:predicted nucleic acid-binding protein
VITAVDTNVLRDVFGADPTFGERSRDALRSCLEEGQLVACDLVWAEVTAAFGSVRLAASALTEAQIEFSPATVTAAQAAGTAWRTYRERGGTRDRLIADFLIGAHAVSEADRLLTRDRGFYRSYFRRLRILDPSA